MKPRRLATTLAALLALLMISCSETAWAAEPASCTNVRFSDVGWTDISATTAVSKELLTGLGYHPTRDMLSVPITFQAEAKGDIDVFQGIWIPTMTKMVGPYLDKHQIDIVRTNLTGAKYTLAVPQYVYDAGVHSFADIARFADKFHHRAYGVEAGNGGNRAIQKMIDNKAFGLGDFELIASSESGMLSQVKRAIAHKDWIVFLGWEPHPMNTHYQIQYLKGGEGYFGPNYGGAVVKTGVRHGYTDECPNVGQLLSNLKFTLEQENQMMDRILNKKENASTAAHAWLKAHPEAIKPWLANVTTIDGKPGLAAVTAYLEEDDNKDAAPTNMTEWLQAHKPPLGDWISAFFGWIHNHAESFCTSFSNGVNEGIDAIANAIQSIPASLVIAAFAILAFALHRNIALTLFVIAGCLLTISIGYWQEMIQTLVLVLAATLVSIFIGVPVGILAAHRPWIYTFLRPVLDLMQTIPPFVYLIPAMVLFSLGTTPALIATVIFAIAAPVRLTYLGVSGVPEELIEAGKAFGASRAKLLYKVEIPAAIPNIMTGISQCIMLSLSMVVIAALVGASGLGKPVVEGLQNNNPPEGFEAGIVIVLLAIMLDRICRLPGHKQEN